MTDRIPYEKPRLLDAGEVAADAKAADSGHVRKCPFCEYDGIHMRRKIKKRLSVTKATCIIEQGYGPDWEAPVMDWRFGVKLYCGKCGASLRYIWGDWHIPDEDEIETFDAIFYSLPNQFDNYEFKDAIIAEAVAAWNRRAE